MGDSLLSTAEAVLGSPLLWGIAALVAVAVTLAGKLDVTAANWVLTAAWGLAAFSVYRSAPILRQNLVPRLLLVMLLSSVVGLALYRLSLWMEDKPQAQPRDVVIEPPTGRIEFGPVSVEEERRRVVRNQFDSFTESEKAALRFIAVQPASETVIRAHLESTGLPWNQAISGRLERVLATRDYTTGKFSVMREYESAVHEILFPTSAPTVAVAPATKRATGPRLVVEQFRVNTPAKVFGGNPTDGIMVREVSYATVTVKNDPLVAGPEGVAKNVTAHVVFSNSLGHYLTVEAEWDKEKQTEPPPKVLDNFFGGGASVWFNVGQRRTVIVAFKMVDDEDAYALTIQPHVNELEVRAPGLALPKGQYQIVVEVRSDTSNIQDEFAFTLRHNGKGTPLELSHAR